MQQFSGFGLLWHGSGGLTCWGDFDIVNSLPGEIRAYKNLVLSIEGRV